ncbi:hypothetical protein PMAYCL1PPCAC_16977 [Pristionchus mayeri]|uniref:Transmembrane ion channel n=1 Tax=Pristionchus mayeri TaxID=1317129 RepID=A0AAN5HZU5_9BILA|nr:hypothetical protein PMAYCL1PPCAC_16977 [Pristionchus mayeri]
MITSGLLILAVAVSVRGTPVMQLPPMPLDTGDKNAVIVTVETFWRQPYWKSRKLENLTLFYSYDVKEAEHCDGKLFSTEFIIDAPPTLTCISRIPIEMSRDELETNELENEKSIEVQFDREIFHSASEVTFFVRVRVHQINGSSLFDQLESSKLRYRLSDRGEWIAFPSAYQIVPLIAGVVVFIIALVTYIVVFFSRTKRQNYDSVAKITSSVNHSE